MKEVETSFIHHASSVSEQLIWPVLVSDLVGLLQLNAGRHAAVVFPANTRSSMTTFLAARTVNERSVIVLSCIIIIIIITQLVTQVMPIKIH